MKVLDLQCAQRHVFEGWFLSEDDFVTQSAGALIACPLCGDVKVSKRLSAPRLNLGVSAPANSDARMVDPRDDIPSAAMQNIWLETARHILATTEDVGAQFTQEARKIHYGEVPERAIRGSATRAETESLLDEGIAVLALNLPDSLKRPLQ